MYVVSVGGMIDGGGLGATSVGGMVATKASKSKGMCGCGLLSFVLSFVLLRVIGCCVATTGGVIATGGVIGCCVATTGVASGVASGAGVGVDIVASNISAISFVFTCIVVGGNIFDFFISA